MAENARGLTLQLPASVIDSGQLAEMSGSAAKVLMVLARHRNFQTGDSWPSVATISREAGLGRKSVFRAIDWLVKAEILSKRRGSGRIGFVNIYQLNFESDPNLSGVSKWTQEQGKGGCRNDHWCSCTHNVPPSTQKGHKKDSKAKNLRKDLNINRFIDHWNSLEIKGIEKRESKVLEKTHRKLGQCLKDYSETEILEAFDNYSKVLQSDEHFFSHKWQLWAFLERGLVDFLSKSKPWENYRNDKPRDHRPSQIGRPTKPAPPEEDAEVERCRELHKRREPELMKEYGYDEAVERCKRSGNRDELTEIERKIRNKLAVEYKESKRKVEHPAEAERAAV